MNVTRWRHWLAVFLVCASARVAGDVVIEDDGVSMSRQELEYVMSQWTSQMRQDGANDLGDRIELLNKAMASKKIAAEAMRLTPEQDGEVYWQKELVIRKALQRFMVERFMETIRPPDMSGLARERYLADKNKYAWMPPARLSSHILIRCGVGETCDRAELRPQAEKLLAELQAGADFEAMVLKYSEDPGSRLKKGRFDKWLDPRMRDVEQNYLKAVFTIESEGEYSGVVSSRFGYHIIRLDEAREGYHKTFEQVKPMIVQELAQEYAELAIKMFEQGYQFTDQLRIDGDVMEEIFNPYKTPE